MSNRPATLSTAEQRRPLVIDSAARIFARSGYLGTTVADVATDAGISPAYVFKLFPSKQQLFVAALEYCFERIEHALAAGAANANDQSPSSVLFEMGGAYAELISDRTLLMLQVHAQSAAEVPEIGAALRHGLERITTYASTRSGAADADVQRFIAFGQLCHLIVTTGIESSHEQWAKLLTDGIRHP